MNELLEDQDYRAAIATIGDSLGPFYLKDPGQDSTVLPLYAAIASLDTTAAGEEWPFVESDSARACLEQMQRGLDDGKPTEDIIWEYRRLFVGPAAKPAPPWGSVYTDRETVVFGETTLKLREWMREKGIARTTDEKTPEDHIGLMLVLLAWIARNKPETMEEFLSDHLLTWSSHFLEELEDAAEVPFFQGLARLTRLSLEGLQEDLGIEVEYPRYYR